MVGFNGGGAGDCDCPMPAYDSETTEPEKENTMPDETGPRYPKCSVVLSGQDGNAFNILAIVNRALKSYGIEKNERDQFMAEAMAGDYDHLLQTCVKWVTAE